MLPESLQVSNFTFRPVFSNSGKEEIIGIEVYETGSEEIYQRIEGFSAQPMGEPDEAIEQGDYNFDGYADIRTVEILPAGPNIPHLYWIYDPDKKLFVKDPIGLSQITSAEFDQEKREIRSFWRGSCCNHGLDIYKLVDGMPSKISTAETESWEEGVMKGTYIRYPGGGVADTILREKIDRYDVDYVDSLGRERMR